MNYNLTTEDNQQSKRHGFSSLKSLIGHMVREKRVLITAFTAMLVTALLNLAGPLIIGYTVDNYITTGNFKGVINSGAILLLMYLIAFGAGYLQTRLMGSIGQRMLFNLRNAVFAKLQELPYPFFNQNKTGDLISRINNDTEKINQFFSQSLMQFLRSVLIMTGAGIFLLSIHLPLGAAALSPAIFILLFTRLATSWVKKRNAASLFSEGMLSSEVQESLNNFKVVVAFNRRDYFREKFASINHHNYKASLKAGIANNVFLPVFTLFSNMGLLIVLVLGLWFISKGQFTIGLLISFIAYVNNFYSPLRQLASLWASFQVALAAWERVRKVLELQNDMPRIDASGNVNSAPLLSFQDVTFSYPNGKNVLHRINFNLKPGKTYAFVGPTGGGKTTTASLAARLFDPAEGKILLHGRDIRSFSEEERTDKIGFILQDPFLFSGTIKENILYGNLQYKNIRTEEFKKLIYEAGVGALLQRFDYAPDTKINVAGEGLSLGQKQIIAFVRAVLRKPDLLILDEATANIDTVTENLLEEILDKLPPTTTKMVIAHRLNTIANADVIYFVNSGNVVRAGSLNEAIEMLMKGNMSS